MNTELADAVRELKLRGLDDEKIVALLSQRWPMSDISKALETLKYMQVQGVSTGAPTESTAQGQIKDMILRRKKHAQYGLAVGLVILVVVMLPKGSRAVPSTIVAFALVWLLLVGMLVLNTNNLPNPKPSYRNANIILYRYLASVALVASLYSLITNALRYLDLRFGFHPGGFGGKPSFMSVVIPAIATLFLYTSINSAKTVESYYKISTRKPD